MTNLVSGISNGDAFCDPVNKYNVHADFLANMRISRSTDKNTSNLNTKKRGMFPQL